MNTWNISHLSRFWKKVNPWWFQTARCHFFFCRPKELTKSFLFRHALLNILEVCQLCEVLWQLFKLCFILFLTKTISVGTNNSRQHKPPKHLKWGICFSGHIVVYGEVLWTCILFKEQSYWKKSYRNPIERSYYIAKIAVTMDGTHAG